MKILSSFTHPQVVPNLHEFLCSAEHKGRYFEESLYPGCFGATLTSIVGKKNTMEVNGAPELLCFPHSSEYLPLCSAEQRHSYRFGTTWGWVNDDRIFIFGWTIPLKTFTPICKAGFLQYSLNGLLFAGEVSPNPQRFRFSSHSTVNRQILSSLRLKTASPVF